MSKTRIFPLLYCCVCFLLLLPPSIATVDSLRLQPNVSTTEYAHYPVISNLTMYYTFTKPLAPLLQDYNYTFYRGGTEVYRSPTSARHYTFDYDVPSVFEHLVADSTANNGSWNDAANLFDGDYATSGQSSGGTYDEWAFWNFTLPDHALSVVLDHEISSRINISVPDDCNKSVLQIKAETWDAARTTTYCVGVDGEDYELREDTSIAIHEIEAHYSNFQDGTSDVQDSSVSLYDADGTRNDMFEDGIVAYYSMDGYNTTDMYDWSANIYHAKIEGGNSTGELVGQALVLDGADDYLKASNVNDPSATDNWTYVAWVRPSHTDAAQEDIVEHGNVQFYKHGTGLRYKEGANYYLASDVFEEDVWVHVAVVRTPDEVIMYKNGVLQSLTGSTALSSNPSDDLFVGILHTESTAYCFDGMIDEVYVYNRTITQSEVLRHYNHTCAQGYCYQITGGNYLMIPEVKIDLSNGSVSFRTKIINWDNTERHILGNSTIGNYQFLTFNTDNNLQLETDTNGDTIVWYNNANDNAWHHYVMTCEDYDCDMYEDGTALLHGGSGVVSDNLTIDMVGNGGSTTYRSLNGTIDDLIIFNHSLSNAQLVSLYENTGYFYPVSNGSYNVTMTYYDFGITGSAASPITNVTYASLNISVYDENTEALVETEVELDLFNDDYTTNLTTSGGTIYSEHVPAGVYTLRYGNDYYSLRQQYVTIPPNPSDNPTTITLYTGNQSDLVTATVYDQNNNYVPDVNIRALRFDSSTGSYIEVDSEDTNFEGQAVLGLELNEELYKFILTYEGRVVLTTSETYIYNTDIDFQISIGEGWAEEFYDDAAIISTITFDTTLNRFTWSYVNPNNGTITACLETYKQSVVEPILLNITCLAADSGIIYSPVQPLNGTTYLVEAYIDYGYGYDLIDSDSNTYPRVGEVDRRSGIFYQAIMTIVAVNIAWWSLSWALIVVPFTIIIGGIIGLHDLHWGVQLSLMIVGVILFVLLQRLR